MSPPPAANPPAVSWNKAPLCGPERPLPKNIIDFIQTWHALHAHEPRGRNGPPFSYRIRSKYAWKVFDRHGRELTASLFQITRPNSYTVLVLFPTSGPACIVSSYFSFSTSHGTFLASWSDPRRGPDHDPYALRVFAPSEDDIEYDPGAWAKLETEHMPRQRRMDVMSEEGARGEGSARTVEAGSKMSMLMSMLDQRRKGKRNSDGTVRTPATTAVASGATRAPATAPVGATQRTTGTTGTAARAMLASSELSDSEACNSAITEYEASEFESSSEEDEEERQEVKDEPPAKRRRTNNQTHLPSPPATATVTATATPREVFFKLTWASVDCVINTSCFRWEKGWTVTDLFQRVAEIIPANPLIRDQINWKALRCELPNEPPLDFFDTNESTFQWLVKRASCIPGDGKPVHIVVKLRAL